MKSGPKRAYPSETKLVVYVCGFNETAQSRDYTAWVSRVAPVRNRDEH